MLKVRSRQPDFDALSNVLYSIGKNNLCIVVLLWR
jgi:hypothetical protein